MKVASRLDHIEPFYVMECAKAAREIAASAVCDPVRGGRPMIYLNIGEPDFGAAPLVRESAQRAIRDGRTQYKQATGMPKLREQIAHWNHSRFGVHVPARRIVVTAGASAALQLACAALFEAGDDVLMPDPCYPCNRHFVRMFEGHAKTIPADESAHYQLSLVDVRQHWGPRTRGVMLASPSNPTGTVVPLNALRAIIAETEARAGFALVDEIYQGLTYDGPHLPTALGFSDRVFVVNSFSKYFCMTGWRLGWLVAPPAYVREMERLAQNAFICVSAPAQYAALAAFSPATIAILEERRAEFQRRRDFLVPALRSLGFGVPLMPEGAFYVYAGCERFAEDSEAFAWRVLDEAGVAITPGIDFGEHGARSHVRFAYTRSLADIEEGMERLGRLLARFR